jgi:malyl-CoA/(S)-citramalyl-CoA lyase
MATEARLHRSELAVPGSKPRMLANAPGLGSDVVMLDLEDSVAPAEKEQARRLVIEALKEQDWSRTAVSVRINSIDTPWCYRDLIEVVEQAGAHVDLITIPKVGSPSDVEMIGALLTQIETAVGLRNKIGIAALVETARGLASVEQIAEACPERLEALIFGVADYAASLQAQTTRIGGAEAGYSVLTNPNGDKGRDNHWGDPWHFALARIAVACRANGLRPIDGPYGDFGDEEGYLSTARRAAVLGYEGKWAIHPSQIPLANEVFTPASALVEHNKRVVAALSEAERDGTGAVSLDGRMIDAASVRMAASVLAKVEQIEARAATPPLPGTSSPTTTEGR